MPEDGDAYIMKHIIHDWDDGRLLESVLLPAKQPDLGKLIDVDMLLMPGGRERTEEEFRRLFARAGYRMTRIVPTQSPLSLIEARSA